jgi:hypothetical protein
MGPFFDTLCYWHLARRPVLRAGPIYYDQFAEEPRFLGLKAVMEELDHSHRVREYANYLLKLYETDQTGFGSGISAMPSVHVGLAVLNALFLSSLNRWAGFIAWPFATVILYGSVSRAGTTPSMVM